MPVHTSPVAIDRSLLLGPARLSVQVRCGGGSMDELARLLRAAGPERIVLVTDPALPRAHGARVLRLLDAAAPTGVLWPYLSGPDARGAGPLVAADGALVVALGGTRVMAASGRVRYGDGGRPPLVRLPTTLRAMSDTALSVAGGPGRTVPAPAVLVRAQLEFLRTLSPGAVRAGVVTVVRDVLAAVPASAGQVGFRLRPDGRYDPATLASFIALSVEARAVLGCHDPGGRGPAAAFRYGEQVARAVPGPGAGGIPYGDALALGLRVAARAARLSGLMDAADEAAHAELLDRAGAVRTLPSGIRPYEVLDRLLRGRESAPMVLLRGLGEPYAHHGRLLAPVGREVLEAALGSVAGVADVTAVAPMAPVTAVAPAAPAAPVASVAAQRIPGPGPSRGGAVGVAPGASLGDAPTASPGDPLGASLDEALGTSPQKAPAASLDDPPGASPGASPVASSAPSPALIPRT
ncbi:hypothetical protein OOK31_01445 [Streptomyces sp. NBC_00249]|uniref:hypothetical protein n=1 Tax=Streptomyces sp. NBC_00249 TaxID=2975690 RepID=UPI0022518498|nr:hypothetical protein [Streptomyces sp. NBC_00249]MCX5192565.1 hypothetical protein [Streptomyces sp. NBC_00249]